MGRHTTGTAEGKEGRIIQELVVGKSVDFVTVPGAGGGIVKVFEAAPGAAKLPAPSIHTFLIEAGRVLSKANEQKLKTALQQLTAVLSLLDSGEADVTSDGEALPATEAESMEVDMDLKEAQEALDASQKELAESKTALAKMQEQLLLREAREFVTAKLTAVTDLPDVTKTRLGKGLVSNPPVKEGKVDEAALQAAIDTAVNEAKAEIAAISGSNGRITGMGESTPAGHQNGDSPKLEESQKRTSAALASLGYAIQEA
jgi:septal ring factor EnvC (AmiA/AmiB activator)